MELGSYGVGAGQGLFESSTTAKHFPGELFVTPDGRRFRYAKAGATLLVAGNVLQAPVEITTHQGLVATAAAVGDKSVTVTLGATNAVTVNQYAGGWAIVTVTPNLGGIYAIVAHPAAAALATLQLQLSDAIRVAWTTSTRVDLIPNPYVSVIQFPSTATAQAVGVAPWAIPAGEWGWIQVGGVAAVLTAGTIAVGAVAVVPSGTGGAVVTDPANASVSIIGQALSATASGETNAIALNMP